MTLDLNERQLRSAMTGVPIAMLAHDETGRIRYLSQELLRVTGYRAEQIRSFADWLALVLDDAETIDKVMAAHRAGYDAAPGPLHRDWETTIRIADGSTRRWLMRAFSIGRDDAGRAVNVSMGVDVTCERATLDALALSESKLRQALRAGAAGNFERDFLRRMTEYSDELMTLHGLAPEQRRETYEQWHARVVPSDRGLVVAYSEAIADADPPLAIEYRIARVSDGAIRRIAERREVRRDGAGRAIGCIGLQRDVTETRAAEQAQRESEARLRLTLEFGEVGTFDWDLAGGALEWDEQVREIWGIDLGTPLTIADFYHGLHPDDVARVEATIAASHDPGGAGGYDTEFRVINRRDGRTRNVSVRGRTLFDAGRPARMIGVVLDVSTLRGAAAVLERDRAELERLVEARTRELAEAQTRLAHAQRMEALSQLAGGIAHDFNNVLQAIEAAADLIERKPDAQNLPRYLRMAREATRRGSAISRRLLSFSHRAELEPERVETVRLIDEVAGILRRTLGLGVTVATDCPADCPALLADRRQLETALLNLTANARDAMGDIGVITLRARPDTPAAAEASRYRAQLRPGDYVRIEIEDTGRGMSAEVRARAAEPFFSTKPRGQGAGLGLSMARGFADQSGGGLRIDSEPDKGASVALWLPVAPPALAETPAQAPAGRGRLLVVDDDPLVRELVGEQLRCAGFSVTTCGEGCKAIEQLDSGLPVDLLLTDFAMPEMNGVTLAHEARKRRPSLPVVVLTGYASEAADAAGEADFALLRKPIDSAALICRVAALIGAG
ncbi:MAG TPA: PAS domain-containing protein [Roseiarcus sp.]|nr:PAS domain-containing protein [Roseiarcus sp.]